MYSLHSDTCQRFASACASTDSPVAAATCTAVTVQSDSDVEVVSVHTPLDRRVSASVNEEGSAGVLQPISNGRKAMGNHQSVLLPHLHPFAPECPQETQTAYADMHRMQTHPSKLRSQEILYQDTEPSEDVVERKRRRRQESEPPQRRRKQPPRSASTQTTTQPAAAVKAQAGAVQAEQAEPSNLEETGSQRALGGQAVSIEATAVIDVPQPCGHAAVAAPGIAQAQTEAGAAGKRISKTARKSTAGAIRKPRAVKVKEEAPARVETVKEEVTVKVTLKKDVKVNKEVKVKKETRPKSATKLQAGVGVIGKVLTRSEMDAALRALKRAEPNQEMKHASGKPSICGISSVQNMCNCRHLRLIQGMSAEMFVCLATGEEPYHAFGIHVNDKPCVSAEEVQMVKASQKKYWEMLQKVTLFCKQLVACCSPWGHATLLSQCKFVRHLE